MIFSNTSPKTRLALLDRHDGWYYSEAGIADMKYIKYSLLDNVGKIIYEQGHGNVHKHIDLILVLIILGEAII